MTRSPLLNEFPRKMRLGKYEEGLIYFFIISSESTANGDAAEIRIRSHAFHQIPRQYFPIFRQSLNLNFRLTSCLAIFGSRTPHS